MLAGAFFGDSIGLYCQTLAIISLETTLLRAAGLLENFPSCFVFPRLFHDAGKELAMLVTALADKATASEDRHLSVLCIGSVWDSWDLLKAGFLSKLREKVPNHVRKVSTTRRRGGRLKNKEGILEFAILKVKQ